MTSQKKALITLPLPFQGLPAPDQHILKCDGVLEQFKKGQDIQKEGQIPSRQVYLHSGYGTLQIRERVLEIVGPGIIFGSTMTRPTPNTCTLRALSPTIAYTFSAAVVRDVWLRNPSVLMSIVDYAIVRVQEYQLFLHHLGTPSLEIRLGAILWRLGVAQPDGSRAVPKEVSQSILAEVLHTTREEVSRRKALLLRMGVLVETEVGYVMPPSAPLILELNEKGS